MLKINYEGTDRGFLLGKFVDLYDIDCSIQESSIASAPAIWLGVGDGGHRMHLNQDMAQGLIDELTKFVQKGSLA